MKFTVLFVAAAAAAAADLVPRGAAPRFAGISRHGCVDFFPFYFRGDLFTRCGLRESGLTAGRHEAGDVVRMPSPSPSPTPEPTPEPEVTAEAKPKRGSVWKSIGEITTLTISFECWFSRKTNRTIIQVLGETKDRIEPLLIIASPFVGFVLWLNQQFEKQFENIDKQFEKSSKEAKDFSTFVTKEFKELRADVNKVVVDVAIIIDRRREHPSTTPPTGKTPPTGGDSECPICGASS
jgi:hypothetical protein